MNKNLKDASLLMGLDFMGNASKNGNRLISFAAIENEIKELAGKPEMVH